MNSVIIKTPIGYLRISEENGELIEIKYLEKEIFMYNNYYSPVLNDAITQLFEYFDGTRKEFSLPLKLDGTEFTKNVLNQLSKVPYGTTITYTQLAEMVGNIKAVRAVGSVMRKNPFIIVLPCHRVLPKKLNFGNYSAGGTANKEWLLTFEKQNI